MNMNNYIKRIKKERKIRKYSQTKSYPLFCRESGISTQSTTGESTKGHTKAFSVVESGNVVALLAPQGRQQRNATLRSCFSRSWNSSAKNHLELCGCSLHLDQGRRSLRCSLQRSSLSFFFKALASINTIWLGSTCQVLIHLHGWQWRITTILGG